MDRLKTVLQMIAIIISMMGIVTFSLFILEESFQTVMFGSWPAQDAKEWRVAKRGVEVQKPIIFAMKAVNWSVGWIQPLGFVAYNAYIRSAEFYNLGLSAKVFAYCPECFDGEEVTFTFRPQRIDNGTAISHNIRVDYPSDVVPTLTPMVVRGMVRVEGTAVRIAAIEVKAVSE